MTSHLWIIYACGSRTFYVSFSNFVILEWSLQLLGVWNYNIYSPCQRWSSNLCLSRRALSLSLSPSALSWSLTGDHRPGSWEPQPLQHFNFHFFSRVQGKFQHFLFMGLSPNLSTKESLKVLAWKWSCERNKIRELFLEKSAEPEMFPWSNFCQPNWLRKNY